MVVSKWICFLFIIAILGKVITKIRIGLSKDLLNNIHLSLRTCLFAHKPLEVLKWGKSYLSKVWMTLHVLCSFQWNCNIRKWSLPNFLAFILHEVEGLHHCLTSKWHSPCFSYLLSNSSFTCHIYVPFILENKDYFDHLHSW